MASGKFTTQNGATPASCWSLLAVRYCATRLPKTSIQERGNQVLKRWLPWLAAVLKGAPAVPAVYRDQGTEAAAVASRVRVTRVLPGDTVDVGQIRILIDFIDVADDA